jgi:hypothetical protein
MRHIILRDIPEVGQTHFTDCHLDGRFNPGLAERIARSLMGRGSWGWECVGFRHSYNGSVMVSFTFGRSE